MVREADLVTGRGNEWRRKTFRVLEGGDPSEATASCSDTDGKEVKFETDEEARMDEFYQNLFDTIPEADTESAAFLRARYESSERLLNGIPLSRVLNYAAKRYSREESKLLSGDPKMDFGSQLEDTFFWYRSMELAAFIQTELDSDSDSQ